MEPFRLVDTPLPRGTMLLEASAGTGKTYTITGLVLRLLLESPTTTLSRILVVTFTRAATQELKTRVRRALQQGLAACENGGAPGDPFLDHLGRTHGKKGAIALRRALQEADELAISTIHGFCKRMLDESAFASAQPLQADFVDDEAPLLLAAAEDAVRLEVQTRDADFARTAREADLLPQELVQQFRELHRYPRTQLLPVPRAIEEVLADRDDAVRALGELLRTGDVPTKELASLPWNKAATDAGWTAPRLGAELVPTLARAAADGRPMVSVYVELAPSGYESFVSAKKKRPSLDHAFFAHCDRVRRASIDLAHALRAALLQRMAERLRLQKRASQTLSFHDLLTDLAEALRDPERGPRLRDSVAARCDVAIVDEFQDTDPLQYEVFRTCFAGRGLYLVGDPKQSIYGFRGADVHAYLAASRDAKVQYSLGQNHRSHPDLVRAVAHLFSGPAAFAENGIAHAPVEAARSAEECATTGFDGPLLQLRCFDADPDEKRKLDYVERVAEDVADACMRILADRRSAKAVSVAKPDDDAPAGFRRLRAGDLAVLTRSNAEAQLVQDELRRRGIPSAIGKAGNVFECAEYDDLRILLEALVAPSRTARLRAAFTTPLFGLSIGDLLALDADLDAMQRELERAEDYRRTWQRHGWLAAFEELLARERVRERLLLRVDGERKLTNYLHLAELLHRAEHDEHRTGEALLAWFLRQRERAQGLDREEKELRLESDAEAVQILTAHGSKGLQYEVVFVPFAWTGRRPPHRNAALLARQPDGSHGYDFGTADPERAANVASFLHDQLTEDLRLLYVALTRARRRCFVHLAPHDLARHSALSWLLLGPGRGEVTPTRALEADWRDGVDPDASAWLAAAEALAASSGGAIGVVRPALEGARRAADAPMRAPSSPRALRPLPEHLPEGFAVTSFTSLCRTDRDAHRGANDSAAEPVGDAPAGVRADEPAVAAPVPDGTPAEGIFAFARGAAAGTALHELVEHADLRAKPADLEALARTVLRGHGLDRDGAHRAPIDAVAVATAMLQQLAQQDLAPLPFRLADLAPHERAAEWRFFASTGRLAAQGLADVFRRHASEELRGYADRVAQLSPRTLMGFLTGSIDLFAMHEGVAYVFDWKSNWLGDRREDYARERLLADVQQNDYVLQYHLYVLAVHRHLRARVPDYDYDRCVGGACYVYLRGLGDGNGTGVFCDRPSRAMVEALDRWLSGRRGGES